MECKLLYDNVVVGEKLYGGTIEKPIDLDFTLPDYCADIQKILKCNITPMVTMRTVTSDRLEMEGSASVRVFYLDSTGKELKFCEKGVPFSASAPLSRAAQSPVVLAEPKMEYVNCRAVSQRRLDIHGAFSINAEVFDNGRFEYVKGIDEDRIEQKKTPVVLSELSASAAHQFMLSSTLETGSSRPVVENIVRSSTSVRVDDIRNMSGNAIIRGNLLISLLYSSGIENTSLEKIEYEIPFNESIETSSTEGGGIISVTADVCDVEISVKSDSVGENSIISFDARIQSELFIYREREIEIVSDAYSREYNTKIEMKNLYITHLKENIHKNEQSIGKINITEGEVESVIDIWNESASSKFDTNKIYGKYNVCILWRGKDQRIYYTEKNIDFLFPLEIDDDSLKVNSKVKVISVSPEIKNPNEIEIKSVVSIDAKILREKNYKFLSSIFEDEDEKIIKADDNSVIIYFASKGESIWSISKEHLSGLSEIKSENALIEDEIREDQTLIIPL